MEKANKYRKPEFPVEDFIINRWSPRALSGEKITREELMPLFEAARWAPSSSNNQPWRFVFALNGSEHWEKFFGLLSDFNKKWVKNAGALILVVSGKNFEYNGQPSITHEFDTGSAFENLALQGTSMGYVVHAMQGFDYDRARKELGIPEEYDIECMVAVGKPGNKKDLPKEMQEREVPSQRKPVGEIIFEGKFIPSSKK